MAPAGILTFDTEALERNIASMGPKSIPPAAPAVDDKFNSSHLHLKVQFTC
jgi:hypothetical protein